MSTKTKKQKKLGKPQQRGQILFAPWSVMSENGTERDVLSIKDEKGHRSYVRLNNGQIVKV